jgi:hypothetical protein
VRSRIVLAGALAVAALVSSSAHAAKAPQITDPKGDALGAQANQDIVSVKLDTTRVGTSKTSAVKQLTITMELAAAPTVTPGLSYQLNGNIAGCGSLLIWTYFSALDGGQSDNFQLGCGGAELDPITQAYTLSLVPTTTIKGNTISWTVSGKQIPKAVKLGTAFNDLFAYTAITEPTFGYTPRDFDGPATDDTMAITYKYGA